MSVKITRATTSAEFLGSLDDLLIQILLRLPVKSLMRFKIVSKRWKSLITSHHFVLMHHHRGPNRAVGLFYPSLKSFQFEYIDFDTSNQTKGRFRQLRFPGDPGSFWIHQSCNGLFLCCSSRDFDCKPRSRRSPIRTCYVYNPTTNGFKRLPRPGVVKEVPRIVVGVNLAFDHTMFPMYKVVCVRGSEFGPDLFQIEIYSAESGAWRLSGVPFSATASFDHGVYWNRSIHWISYAPKELLYFNVDKEKFGKMPLPGGTVGGHRWRRVDYFGESCGHLHIIETLDYTQLGFDVYEMKRDYSEWFVKYRADLNAVAAAFPEMALMCITYFCVSVVSLVQGEEGDSFLVLKIFGKLIRLNLDINTVEKICDLGNAVIYSLLPQAFGYIESLASV